MIWFVVYFIVAFLVVEATLWGESENVFIVYDNNKIIDDVLINLFVLPTFLLIWFLISLLVLPTFLLIWLLISLLVLPTFFTSVVSFSSIGYKG